ALTLPLSPSSFQRPARLRSLHSFPTRRSSDLLASSAGRKDRNSFASIPSEPDSRQKRISSAVLSVSPGYTLQARRLQTRRAASRAALSQREGSKRSQGISVSGFQRKPLAWL